MRDQCFCGSQRLFARCCEPYLLGTVIAPTAEALMRSRYSAFCTRNVDYLIATHHPTAVSASDRESLVQTFRTAEWINLLIISKQKGQKKDKTGIVEFVAAYRPRLDFPVAVSSTAFTDDRPHRKAGQESSSQPTPNNASQLHERSQFVQARGQWFYLAGESLPPYQPRRSHPCWCGSAKPFKHCHG